MSDFGTGPRSAAAVSRTLALACVVAIAVLALCAIWLASSGVKRAPSDVEVVEWIDPALSRLTEIERAVVDSDRLLRLYVLQGRPADAKAYEARRAEASKGVADLTMTVNEGSQEARQAAGEVSAAANRWLGFADEWYRAAQTAGESDARTAVLARIGPEDPLASLDQPSGRLESLLRDAREARLTESVEQEGSRKWRFNLALLLWLAAVGTSAWVASRAMRPIAVSEGNGVGLARVVLDQIPEGVAVFDTDGRVVVANAAAARITEPLEEGGNRLALFDADGSPVAEATAPLARALAGHHVDGEELYVRRPDGLLVPVTIYAEPIIDGGRATAAVVAVRDRAEQRRLEEEVSNAVRRAESAEANVAAITARLRKAEADLVDALEASESASREAEARENAMREAAVLEAETRAPAAHGATNGRAAPWRIEEVLTAVANDLRTPVHSIRGMVDLFRQKYADAVPDVTALHSLELTQRNADQIATLIDELGDLAELGEQALSPTEFPLTSAVEEAWRASKHEGIELRVAGPMPTIRADHAKLLRALGDLFETAARFRRDGDGAWMHVAARDVGDAWEIELRDNGTGFDASHAEALFGPLARSASTARENGHPTLVASGLGLATLRRVAELHGGTASAASRPDGATYLFTIAKNRASSHEQPTAQAALSPGTGSAATGSSGSPATGRRSDATWPGRARASRRRWRWASA
jgi:signal transduction histidine kinase